MTMQQTPKDPYMALRYSDYRFYVLTRILMTIALQIQVVVGGLANLLDDKRPFLFRFDWISRNYSEFFRHTLCRTFCRFIR